MLIKAGHLLSSIHFGEKSSASMVAEMESHPTDSKVCLLRNKTGDMWKAIAGNKTADVPPGKAIALHPGIQIKTANHALSVYP